MTIHIVKKGQVILNDAPTVYCGRGSALGNPFHMTGEDTRDRVCEQYADWFQLQLQDNPDSYFHQQLNKIEKLSRAGDVNLQCFCAPKRCHTETIKAHIESKLLEK